MGLIEAGREEPREAAADASSKPLLVAGLSTKTSGIGSNGQGVRTRPSDLHLPVLAIH
jgi:hypothetical protein